MAIIGFADAQTARFFMTGSLGKGAKWQAVKAIARRKLDMLHYAARLHDLASPPGNRLEALQGSLRGCHSIRINDQWRVVFRWTLQGPDAVRILDYH